MGQKQTKQVNFTQAQPPPCAGAGASASASASASAPSPCPVIGVDDEPKIYNVYNTRIKKEEEEEEKQKNSIWSWGYGYYKNSSQNNMPISPNQQPAVGQRKPISTNREPSSIPKSGTSTTWTYPSPQMFFNALVRKEKAEGVEEDDMDSVVFFHNGMNEETWKIVKKWELLHQDECNDPALLRFRGRPDELSPLARWRSWFGKELPFDRHDWYIDRCGKEVRYVIDFYFDESKAGSMDAFEVEVRPAIDNFENTLDRIKMGIYVTCYKYGLPCPISGHPSSTFR